MSKALRKINLDLQKSEKCSEMGNTPAPAKSPIGINQLQSIRKRSQKAYNSSTRRIWSSQMKKGYEHYWIYTEQFEILQEENTKVAPPPRTVTLDDLAGSPFVSLLFACK